MGTVMHDLIAVGRICGSHGIRGQLRLHSYSGNLETLHALQEVVFQLPGGEKCRFRLKRAVLHGTRILLTVEGVDTIEDAERLAGAELLVQQDQLPETGDDEYYWKDLIGLSVVTCDGVTLGKITRIMETGANDVYLVKNGKQEYLIPAIADVIQRVDLTSGTMTITPLEGLLDL